MAKVVIFEDSIGLAIERYKRLVKDHDVHVFMLIDRKDFDADLSLLIWNGFKETQVYPGILDEEIMDADVYFVDGLEGKCFDLLPRLPKEKTYLVTMNENYEERAVSEGYNVALEREIPGIVSK